MNDIVLILVAIAAIVLVGLFVWNHTQTNKGEKAQAPGLSKVSTKKLYDNIQSMIKPQSQPTEANARIGLVDEKQEKLQEAVVMTAPEVKEEVVQPAPAQAPVEEKPVEPVVQKPESVAPVVQFAAPKAEPVAKPVEAPKPEQEVLPFVAMNDDEEKEDEEVVAPTPVIPKEGLKTFEVDPLMETVGMIHATKPILGSLMLEMANNLKKLGLPIRVYVRRADNKRWYAPSNEGMYTEMAVVLLLANRLMVIDEMDASRFAMGIQQVGIALEADSESESTMSIMERARELHENVKRLDVQLSVVLSARSAVKSTAVNEAARLAGFTQLNSTRYVFGSAKQIGEATIFLRHDEFDVRYLYLLLDAPLAVPNNKPLHQFFSVANDLCSRLDMELQDSKGTPINTAAAQMIFRQLADYYSQMQAAKIEPGSQQARVLFTREG
ncbi:MAG: hypothetical protein J6V64_03000 [Burkholderiaceae bacterium]|nr:hypothetical protein [Burkholderiaceae bacterium]